MQTEKTTITYTIHWAYVLGFLAVISFVFFYGYNYQNTPQITDNKPFLKKIDSLESCIQNYENQAEQQRIYRNELHKKKDSLENVIVLYNLYLPSLQELKRTKAP